MLRSRHPHRSGVFGNNVVTANSFDANTGRLLNICATTSAGTCNGNVANLSYDWDTIGNLTDRADTYEGYTEEFCYDTLNRLVNYAIASTCTSSGDKTVAYDSLGDISSKSDVGTYSYPASGSGSVRPHAVEISVSRICLTIVSREGREAAITQAQPRYALHGKYQQRQLVM
jgi:hypothetical protein